MITSNNKFHFISSVVKQGYNFYVGIYAGVYAKHIVGSKIKYFVCLSNFQNHVIKRNFSELIGH